MSGIPFDIVGFDLDGTLLDTSGDLAAAVNHALASIGRPLFSAEAIKPFVGRGAKVMLERALMATGGYSDSLLADLLPPFFDYYRANVSALTQPYPGLIAALNTLRDAGTRLAICTNKSERFTLPLIADMGLGHYFAAVVCGDSVGVQKPDPAPIHAMIARAGGGRSVFVGDTINDIEGARRAGVPSIAVSFGFVDHSADLKADAVIGHFDELLPLLKRWPG